MAFTPPSSSRYNTQIFAGTPSELPTFSSEKEYIEYMSSSDISQLPKGFAIGTSEGKFVSVEAPSMGELPIKCTVISLTEGPTDNWAAVFTTNKFPGAPVKIGRSRLKEDRPLEALVINNKVSNVCSGGDGVADSELVCDAVTKALKGSGAVLPCSTGVIGWRLPAEVLAEKLVPEAVANMQSESVLDAASAIMTTDRYPKIRSSTISDGRIVAIGKGAGMIEPNMATMLVYILTDLAVPKDKLRDMLSDVVDQSFNCISVDGDESTSDTAVLVSSNQVPFEESMEKEFKTTLQRLCTELAADIVRNGEGTAHVMRVQIRNFPGSESEARSLGRRVVNSPLFKCAVNGNDPNTGRLAGAVGSFLGRFSSEIDETKISMTLGNRRIFNKGQFVLKDDDGNDIEKELSQHMKDAEYEDTSNYPPHQKFVEIGIDFDEDSKTTTTTTVLGSDLSKEYVTVNADYRS
eukprot:CAMPEP_0194130030 /NCGR_PEP_ID=MMETSP0152-20130528/1197_1 /TAXON_ID=1049557 /ORGANISM="Thalassiothrix antarctica, Strain L6-D1" /LENGTH=462 /DNA_ID=CAMNT_0038824445 /DNA_START=178 /DNA_END=1566 /DNA_ORIENTATION=+